MNSDAKNALPKKRAIIKDSELCSSAFDWSCGEWLRSNYGDIARIIYERHSLNQKEPTYRSKRVQSIAEVCCSDFARKESNRAFVLSKIRISLQEKNKHRTKFTVQELEDFCELKNTTPNEIIGIGSNPVRSISILTKEQIGYIQSNFDKFNTKGRGLQIPCLCFPLLGVFSVVCFEKRGYIDSIIAQRQKGTNTVSVSYKTIVFSEDDQDETMSGDYHSMKGAFFWAVKEAAEKHRIKNLMAIPEMQPLIELFFETEYMFAEDKDFEYSSPIRVSASDRYYV